MQKEKTKRRGNGRRRALVMLAAAVLMTAASAQAVPADGGYGTLEEALEAGCSITVTPPEGDDYNVLPEVTLDFYKVASAERPDGFDAYTFVWEEAFAEGKAYWDPLLEKAAEGGITGAEIDQLTQALAGIALTNVPEYEMGAAAGEAGEVPAHISAPLTGGPTDVEPGLYLILAHGKENNYKVAGKDGSISTGAAAEDKGKLFQFAPMLVSVPQRGASVIGSGSILDYLFGSVAGTYDIEKGDTLSEEPWQNSIVINAKAAFTDLLGSLQITKELTNHEHVEFTREDDPDKVVRADQVTCVFDVTVRQGEDIVFSNVYTRIFDGAGSMEPIIIEDLPVKSVAEVKEVYAGNYAADESYTGERAITIEADNYDAEGNKIIQTETAEFTNTYQNTWRGGGSVTNKYKMAEGSDPGSAVPEFVDNATRAGE